MGYMSTVRDAVYNAILQAKTNGDYIYNGFDLEWTYVPVNTLEALATGKVWVVGLPGDDGPNKTRVNHGVSSEIAIQIAFQIQCDREDKVSIDAYVRLFEQLRDTCRLIRNDEENWQWVRNEAMRDQNGTPYSYMALRENATFEGYVTAYYQATLT